MSSMEFNNAAHAVPFPVPLPVPLPLPLPVPHEHAWGIAVNDAIAPWHVSGAGGVSFTVLAGRPHAVARA